MPTKATALLSPLQWTGLIARKVFGWRKTDTYVLGEVFGPFLGGIVFFTFVFLMFQALRLANFFIVHDIPGYLIGKMVFLMVLSFLPYTLPVAFLIGVLVGFGRISADSELVALKACGISIYRMTASGIILAVIVAIFSLALNMEWVPWGNRQFRQIHIKIGNTKASSAIKEGTFTRDFFDLLIFADKVDQKTGKMHNVFIYDEREPKNPLTVVASEGEIVPIFTGSDLGASIVMKLVRGNIHSTELEAQKYQKINFEQYLLYLEIPEGADAGEMNKAKVLSHEKLVSEIAREKVEGEKNSSRLRSLQAEYWRRYSVALTPFIFLFIGIGFGTIRTRSVRAGAALVAVIVVITYWLLQLGSTYLAHRNLVNPAIAMQIPNFLLAIAAIWGYRKASW